jgi:hypothetical protein
LNDQKPLNPADENSVYFNSDLVDELDEEIKA